MGQKVNPNGFRVGVTKPWISLWYGNKKDYRSNILEDYKIRKYLKEKHHNACISSIEIERMGSKVRVILNTSRPGVIIGKKGSEIEKNKR